MVLSTTRFFPSDWGTYERPVRGSVRTRSAGGAGVVVVVGRSVVVVVVGFGVVEVVEVAAAATAAAITCGQIEAEETKKLFW